MIATIKETTNILNKYNLLAKKKYGQNFLIDINVVNKIVKTSGIDKDTGVIEIGPGIGGMTEVLCEKGGKVLCFEIDPDMVEVLRGEIKSDNIKIINEDFLKVDLNKEFHYFEGLEKIVVVSNLPYYVTTPIIMKLLEYDDKISSMYFMVQKEVCDRLSASPKTKEYGSLSVIIKLKGDCKKEFIVTRNSFYPAPNVDSAIVSIKFKENDCREDFNPKFTKFIQNIFEQKRKTIVNNICNNYNVTKEEFSKKMENIGYNPQVRAEALSLEDIKKIYALI